MKQMSWKELKKMVDARTLRERAMLLTAVLVVLGYSWVLLVYDQLNRSQAETERLISNTTGQINRELSRNENVRESYTQDPNAFVRTRIANLEEQLEEVNEQLLGLYGELILPQQMAGVLTQILQSETTLKLVSFANLSPELLVDESTGQVDEGESISVYRHGLQLEFEGDYLETIRFLKKVEGLDTSFFWDSLQFQLDEYPKGRISLSIFTLSTERGFIGV